MPGLPSNRHAAPLTTTVHGSSLEAAHPSRRVLCALRLMVLGTAVPCHGAEDMGGAHEHARRRQTGKAGEGPVEQTNGRSVANPADLLSGSPAV
jgi:hypothetical protein